MSSAPTPVESPVSQSNPLQNDLSYAILGGSVLLTCLAIAVCFIWLLKKQNRKLRKQNEQNDIGVFIGDMNKQDFEADAFTLSGFTELQRRRSGELESLCTIQTCKTLKTTVTMTDKTNFSAIKSVISDNTECYKFCKQKLCSGEIKLTEKRFKAVLTEIVASFEDNIVQSGEVKETIAFQHFNNDILPTIDIESYLLRLSSGLSAWYLDTTEESTPDEYDIGLRCILIALEYLSKLKQQDEFELTVYNVHRLFAVMVLVAAKFTEDEIMSNAYWSTVAGLTLEDTNILEDRFCFKLDFDFYVNQEVLTKRYIHFMGRKLKDFTQDFVSPNP